jgi:uncharacterized protein YndB with AHSA1/START domain
MSTTRLIRRFDAPASEVYRALTEADAVAAWMFPNGMRIEVHAFEPRVGGRCRISLTYDEVAGVGKTSARTDTYHGRFVELAPGRRVVQALEFETADPAMRGEMRITFTLREVEGGTELEAVHENVPPGVAPADNETGWRMSLDRLGRLLGRAGA